LRARIFGTVSRFIGAGVGLARLVEVSIWNVVDMAVSLAAARQDGKGAYVAERSGLPDLDIPAI